MYPAALTIRSQSALAIAMVEALLRSRGVTPATTIRAVHDRQLATPGVRLEIDDTGDWLYLAFEPTAGTIEAALADGAGGILTLENNADELEQALTTIVEDGVGYLPVNVLRMLTTAKRNGTNGHSHADELALLSSREVEVLMRIARGESNGDIAAGLGISYHTVRSHVRTLAIKLGTGTRSQLLAQARQLATNVNGTSAIGAAPLKKEDTNARARRGR